MLVAARRKPAASSTLGCMCRPARAVIVLGRCGFAVPVARCRKTIKNGRKWAILGHEAKDGRTSPRLSLGGERVDCFNAVCENSDSLSRIRNLERYGLNPTFTSAPSAVNEARAKRMANTKPQEV